MFVLKYHQGCRVIKTATRWSSVICCVASGPIARIGEETLRLARVAISCGSSRLQHRPGSSHHGHDDLHRVRDLLVPFPLGAGGVVFLPINLDLVIRPPSLFCLWPILLTRRRRRSLTCPFSEQFSSSFSSQLTARTTVTSFSHSLSEPKVRL